MKTDDIATKKHVGALLIDSLVVWIPIEHAHQSVCRQLIISRSQWLLGSTTAKLDGYTVIKLKNK